MCTSRAPALFAHILFPVCKGCGKPKQACAMCRQEIPADFLDHPTLLSSIEAEKEEVLPGGYQWFYEGRNGWWRYDERTNTDIEEAYAQGETSLTLLIAGYNYDIDLTNMKQARADCPGLRRRIKRDVVSSSAKGTAGLSTKLFRGQGGRGRSRGRKRKSDDKD
nr:E3 ubiquitin-protein ligase rnf146-like [Penaeus vannamei]